MIDLQKVITELQSELQQSVSRQQTDEIEIAYLGRNGKLNELMKQLKDASPEERKTLGIELNKLKQTVVQALADKKQEQEREQEQNLKIDITIPGKKYPRGSVHMVTLAVEEISRIFEKLGFIRMSYPEVEWEWFSFDALNMPSDHPARDDFETFFIDFASNKKWGKMVLTPHTSSGQPREMLRLGKPPIRMINLAKTYRPNWDASHVPMFHQFEGVCIDEGINITHLKGTIDHFAKEFFGENRKTRLRPFHFQFTEPSFEVDVSCGVCGGTGKIKKDNRQQATGNNDRNEYEKCKICKSGWLELGGAGMMHPNVLKAGGIDPEKYTGWAFGMGVERNFMMKEGFKLDDIRVLYNGDIRFLEQF